MNRLANVYFLIIVIICFIPALSPQTPVTSLAPLVLVLALQALKDGLEDLKRHRSDDADNNSEAVVIRNGILCNVTRKEVRVGDILQVDNSLIDVQGMDSVCRCADHERPGERPGRSICCC